MIQGNRFLPSWPLIAFVVVTLAVLFSGERPLQDGDTYMHVGIGNWIIEHQIVPKVDVFSHTMAGQPWAAHEWLSEVILALAYQWGGWTGLVLLTGLCTALTITLMLRFMLDRMQPIYALGFASLTYLALLTHLLARPHVLTWPLIVLWMIGLLKALEQHRRPSWWLLLVMVLWVNLHGGFMLGLALLIPVVYEAVFSTTAVEQGNVLLRWSGFALAVLLASLVNPAGYEAYSFLFHLMGNDYLAQVREWQPPDLARFGALEIWIYALLAMGLVGMLRLPLIRTCFVLGLLYQALAHVRYLSIFALLTPLIIAAPFGKSYAHWQRQFRWVRLPGEVVASQLDNLLMRLAGPSHGVAKLLSVAALLVVAVFCAREGVNTPATDVIPKAAVDAVLTQGITGTVFNLNVGGGYLIFRGIPAYTDGRADLYGAEFMKRQQELLKSNDASFIQKRLDEVGVGWILLPASAELGKHLNTMPDWKNFYVDQYAVVFIRARIN